MTTITMKLDEKHLKTFVNAVALTNIRITNNLKILNHEMSHPDFGGTNRDDYVWRSAGWRTMRLKKNYNDLINSIWLKNNAQHPADKK